jgi:mRNA-degrading endonuclease toxin of MazEF toxin-antitoxin module
MTQNRRRLYEAPILKLAFLNAASVANVPGIDLLPVVRFEPKLGTLFEKTMTEIRRALVFELDLESSAG